MRLIIVIISLIITCNIHGQSKQLIPVDSSNLIYVNDSIINLYQTASDSSSRFRFDPEEIKYCPCSIEGEDGIISFKSSSFLIKQNMCFYIYEVNNGYFVRVGKMTKTQDKQENHIWEFKTKSIKQDDVKELLKKYEIAIKKAEIPKYDSRDDYPVVYDEMSYIFGDIRNNSFYTTPQWDFSVSVKEIIKISEKLVKRKFR